MPLVSIITFSFVITLFTTLTYKLLTNQDEMKKMRERTKALQEQLKNEKDQNKILDIQKEMLQISMKQMKHSMKPMLFTFIPIILAFALLRSLYTKVGDILIWGFNMPFFGTGGGWFFSYFLFSIIFSVMIRKILKIS